MDAAQQPRSCAVTPRASCRYDYLLWFMRLVALLYLAAEVLRFVAYARLYPHTDKAGLPLGLSPGLPPGLPTAPPPPPHGSPADDLAPPRP